MDEAHATPLDAAATAPVERSAAASMAPNDRYLNRELSWLRFNDRVLEEASNPEHPLLERLRFLSIAASNLDEFFMVRVAGLKDLVKNGVSLASVDGMSPAQQLEAIGLHVKDIIERQEVCWAELHGLLREAGIEAIEPSQLTADDEAWLESFFEEELYPILSPIAVDPAHPFPFVPNQGLGVVVQFEAKSEARTGLILIPEKLDRMIRLPGAPIRFIAVEKVVMRFLDRLFPGFEVRSTGVFRVLRDSDIEIEEEAEDLMRVF
ncbi:MAG: RNA degradosome polyphosphate kinase, partial [Pseudomonadota bacterium]